MQVHLSSRGWSVWPQWLSLLDSTVLSFPSTPAHSNMFDLVATSSSRVQMQPKSSQCWIPFARCDVFPLGWAWTCPQGCWVWQGTATLSPGTACGVQGVREGFLPRKALCCPFLYSSACAGTQSRAEHAQVFTESKPFHPEETVTSAGICHSGALRSCGSLENTWLRGNVWLNSNIARSAKSFSYRVSSPSFFHFPFNPISKNSSYLQRLCYLLYIYFCPLVTK